MRTTKLLSFAAALLISANVMMAQADCVRELLGASKTLDVAYVHGATEGIQWNNATGVLSGNFTALQGQWAGQLRLNFAPVSVAGVNHITIRMRVEVGGEGTTPGGGYLPLQMNIYNVVGASETFTGILVTQPAMRPAGNPHYLVFENIEIPAAMTQFTQLRFILHHSHANTTFSISQISICEVDFVPPPLVCAENLFEGVTKTLGRWGPAAAQTWAAWNNGVINITTQAATSSPWDLQFQFDFPNITVDHREPYGLFMDIEVAGGTLTCAFRVYRLNGGELNYPGPGPFERRAFPPGTHQVEFVRHTNPSTFTFVNRFSLFGGAPAGTTITISNIRFCRMAEDGVSIPPIEGIGMSIYQTGDMIVINSDVEITSVVMHTIGGKQVPVALGGNQINTSALASGVYLLQVNGTNVFRVVVR